MVEIWDYRIREFCLRIADGDRARANDGVNWFASSFQHFDKCDSEQANSARWSSILSTGVVRYILDNVPDPNFRREALVSAGLPVQVLMEIHIACAEVFNRVLGLRLKIGKIPTPPSGWDDVIGS
jgi:hypothetical protein